jgi:hypothetical protein
MPKIERVFEDSNAAVNPHLNPFLQLNESTKQNQVKPPNTIAPT